MAQATTNGQCSYFPRAMGPQDTSKLHGPLVIDWAIFKNPFYNIYHFLVFFLLDNSLPFHFQMNGQLCLLLLGCLIPMLEISFSKSEEEKTNSFIEIESVNKTHTLNNYSVIFHNRKEECFLSSKCSVYEDQNFKFKWQSQFHNNEYTFLRCTHCSKSAEEFLSRNRRVYLSASEKVKELKEQEMNKFLEFYKKRQEKNKVLNNMMKSIYNENRKKMHPQLSSSYYELHEIIKKWNLLKHFTSIEELIWLAFNLFLIFVGFTFLYDTLMQHIRRLERLTSKIQRKHERRLEELLYAMHKVHMKQTRRHKDKLKDWHCEEKCQKWDTIFDHL